MLNIVVTVAQQKLADIADVAEKLREHGMTVTQIHTNTGLIVGTVPDDLRVTLGSVSGVFSVDVERDYQLPPPDADIQ